MRPFVARLLTFFLLFANVAWAADIHEVTSLVAGDTVMTYGDLAAGWACPSDTQKSQDDGRVVPCDHCCHGTSHYLGVLPDGIPNASHANDAVRVPGLVSYLSRAKEPPLQPPKI